LFGRVVETITNNPITGVQIQTYVAPRDVDGSMKWQNSAFTDSGGWYTFLNADLDGCRFFLEASTWENNYVGAFYAETVANQQVLNPNRATEISLCNTSTRQIDFTLSNGGIIEGTILTDNGVGSLIPVDGIRITASAALTYPQPTTVTVQNDGQPPYYPTIWLDGYEYELIPTNVQVEDRVFLKDTYTREFFAYYDPVLLTTITSCNFRANDTPGHFLLQGIALPETNSGLPPTHSEIVLNIDAETTRCDTFINYQAAETRLLTFPDPGVTINIVDTNFTLLNGYSIIGSVTSAPGSLCNASIGLYRNTTIYLTTINVTDDGPVTEIYPVTFDKLEAIKNLNPIYPDWLDTDPDTGYDDGAGTHLTCDNFIKPRYSNHFTFGNLSAGDYRLEYIEDYIWSVYQRFPPSGHISLDASQTVGNVDISINNPQASAAMPPPKVFLNTLTNCSSLRLTCWLTGRPPTVCDTDPVPMDPGVCHDYTMGNLLQSYVLDSRPTHYYIDFYSDSGCTSFATTQTVHNYSILNWDTMLPRKCDCFDPAQGIYYKIRAVNFYNDNGSTNSSSSVCMDSSASYDIRTAFLQNEDTAPYLLAGIRPGDYISNTMINTAANFQMSGLQLINQKFHPLPGKAVKKTKKPVPTVQLASLNWTDYLFGLLKNMAGKFSSQWGWDEAGGIGAASYVDSGVGAVEEDPGLTQLFPDLPSFEYVTSNLPDTDGDHLPDYWETCKGLDLNDPTGAEGAEGDPDGDGLLNYWEYFYGTDPGGNGDTDQDGILDGWDTDNDGMPDGWEVVQELNPLIEDSNRDEDRDGWTNLEEFLNDSDPNQKATTLFVDGSVSGGGTGTQSDPFPTIEQALDASTIGNVILVAGGYYDAPQVYQPAADLVIGEGRRLIGDASATTKIDLGSSHQIEINDRGSLIGFTIVNPPADVPAIQVSSAAAKIANNILLGSYDPVGTDTGIFLSSSSSDIHNNLIRGFASGIELQQNSSPDIRNNIINQCTAAITADSSTPAQEYNSLLPEEGDELLFVDAANDNFHLFWDSPLRDSGDPGEYFNDLDDSTNDIGQDGGPYGVTDLNVPFASISITNKAEDGNITFDGSGSRDEWGILDYLWDFGCETPPCESTVVQPTYQFTGCGDYLVTLTVTDHNFFRATSSTMVKVGEPPEVSFQTSPQVPVVGQTVTFTGSGISEVGTPSWTVEYLTGEQTIDFSSICQGSSEPNLTCNFDQPGLYEVNMYVDDGSCRSMASELVTVIGEYQGDAVSQSIGVDGGVFSVGDENNPLNGIELDIPPKALSEAISLTISQPSDLPALSERFTAVSIPFDFGPEGLNFSLPARLSVPFTQEDLVQAGVVSAEYLMVVWYDTATSEWKEVPVIEIDQDLSLLVVEINHFSSYRMVTASKPETPEELQASAVSKSNIMLSWQYSSSYVDGFIIQRQYTEEPCNKEDEHGNPIPEACDHKWTAIATVDKNPTNIYTYVDTVSVPSTVFYYRIIAFKYQVVSSKEKIESDPSNEVFAKTQDWQYIKGGDSDDGSGQRSLDLGSSTSDESQSSGGGASTLFGCGLIHQEPGNATNILLNILVLFFPLLILRRLNLRRR
jgi:parallel beta-helix repeat protein